MPDGANHAGLPVELHDRTAGLAEGSPACI